MGTLLACLPSAPSSLAAYVTHCPLSSNQRAISATKGTLPWPWTPGDSSRRTVSRKHSISQRDDDDDVRRGGDMRQVEPVNMKNKGIPILLLYMISLLLFVFIHIYIILFNISPVYINI